MYKLLKIKVSLLTKFKKMVILYLLCDGGGIGRRARLRGVWATVWVQVPSFAPIKKNAERCFFIGRDGA